jgi:hypothetical protein
MSSVDALALWVVALLQIKVTRFQTISYIFRNDAKQQALPIQRALTIKGSSRPEAIE